MKAKMSELIRLGSMISGQTTGRFMVPDGRTCAMGSMLLAYGVDVKDLKAASFASCILSTEQMEDLGLNMKVVSPTYPRAGEWPIETVIVELNDMRGWSRERIADWVESVEREQEATKPETQELAVAV